MSDVRLCPAAFVLAIGLSIPSSVAGQRVNPDAIVERINAILQVAAIDSPPPRLTLEGDSTIVFATLWDSVVPDVNKKIHVRDIGSISPRTTSRPEEPANYRLELTVSCLEEGHRCVRVLTPDDSLAGSSQRIRFVVWRDSPEALELTRLLRELVQGLRFRPIRSCHACGVYVGGRGFQSLLRQNGF